MAETFTGLKLQGDIGKFGNVELSDVSAFVEIPNGKIICGCENGTLLLWDNMLIQMVMGTAAGPCHAGMVEFLAIEDGQVISAGADGCIKTWDLQAIIDGDVDNPDDQYVCFIFFFVPGWDVEIVSIGCCHKISCWLCWVQHLP
jgi:hypothetical protein